MASSDCMGASDPEAQLPLVTVLLANVGANDPTDDTMLVAPAPSITLPVTVVASFADFSNSFEIAEEESSSPRSSLLWLWLNTASKLDTTKPSPDVMTICKDSYCGMEAIRNFCNLQIDGGTNVVFQRSNEKDPS